MDRGEKFEDGNWFHDVQLKLPVLRTDSDTEVVADGLETAHVAHLGDDGIHLPGHDGGSRRHRWEIDFAEATPRSGSEQSEVIANLRGLHSHTPQDAGEENHGAKR